MTKRLSELEIRAVVVPTMIRWPAADVAKTIAWEKLREAVEGMRSLVFAVDAQAAAAERDPDLSPEGVGRKRAKVGVDALNELSSYDLLKKAEAAVAKDIEVMEKLLVDLPKAPDTAFAVEQSSQILAHIRKQNSPIDFVMANLSDPRVVSSVLHSPAFLSGLGDAEWNLVRERARASLHPVQIEMTDKIKKALAEVHAGVAAAERLILQRTETRRDIDPDGSVAFRYIREPQPQVNLTQKGRDYKAGTVNPNNPLAPRPARSPSLSPANKQFARATLE